MLDERTVVQQTVSGFFWLVVLGEACAAGIDMRPA